MPEDLANSKLTTQPVVGKIPESPLTFLAREYRSWGALFHAQPTLVGHFLEAQARRLAIAIVERQQQIRFNLPDRLVVEVPPSTEAKPHSAPVPAGQREQTAGGFLDRLTRSESGEVVRQRLDELESDPDPAVAASAGLLRYAAAVHMVSRMLPVGRTVAYLALEGEEIASIPVPGQLDAQSALAAAGDAIVEEGESQEGRGELQVPFVPAARRFYLPQWVAFDDQDRLLVGSVKEAEAHLASMQRFLAILHAAVSLAPYMVADETYQSKRYGMLGQLVNQGRALARFETREIIATIRNRAAAHNLNRGLSLSLPFFDDQSLGTKTHDFDIIPAGRIMFVPAFVVMAARKEQAKVAQDTRLSPSTRKHLLFELQTLEAAFEPSQDSNEIVR